MLVAGSIGNGIDRTLSTFNIFNYTGVIDFIYVTFFANFNFADICVTLSCIFLLIYFSFVSDDKIKKAISTNNDTTIDNSTKDINQACKVC